MAEHELNKIVDDDGEVFNLRDSTKQPTADRVTAWGSTPSDTKYPSEKLVKNALDGKVPGTALSVSVPANSTRYVKMVVPDGYHHYLVFFNASMGVLHAEWLFRTYGSGGIARTIVNYIGTTVSERKWYVAGADGLDYYIEFVNDSTSAQSLSFKVCALDISTLPTLSVVDTLPSGYSAMTIYGTVAEKLRVARNLAVDLSNTSTNTSFNGTANVTNIKTTGVLGVANGGTGNTSVDTTPTANSTKMVTSGGIKTALDAKAPNAPSEVTIATGDKPLIADSSDGNKVKRASITFDTGVPTTYLCRNGTFNAVKEADVTWGGSFRAELSPAEFGNMARNIIHNPVTTAVTFEITTDGGTTWAAQSRTDAVIRALCNLAGSGGGSQFGLPNALYSGVTDPTTIKGRLTIYAISSPSVEEPEDTWFYGIVKRILVKISRAGDARMKVEYLTWPQFIGNKVWVDAGTFNVQGDSGWNSIPFDNTLGGYVGQLPTGRIIALRFTYWIESGTAPRISVINIGFLPQIHWNSNAGNIPLLGVPISIHDDGKGAIEYANKLYTSRKLKTNLARTADSTFDGSADQTNIPVTGTLPIANGGTGKTTARDACNSFINALDYGSSTPVDADYYISQYVGGGTTTTTYHRRPVSALWNYIKGKISSVLGLSENGYTGNAATATAAQSGSALETAINGKVDKVTGKGLSTNDYTTTEKNKLAGIASGAEVNVQSDWNQTTTTADDYIKNKPTLGTAAAKDVPTSGNASNTQVVMGNDSRLADSRTPTSHASSATTYGVGTTSNYGHVKLATGDMNGATHADGVAVSKNHTHSQYLTSHQSISGKMNTSGDNAEAPSSSGGDGATATLLNNLTGPNGLDDISSDNVLIPTTNSDGTGQTKWYKRPLSKLWPWIISHTQIGIYKTSSDVYLGVGADSNHKIDLDYDGTGASPQMGVWVRWGSGSNAKWMAQCDSSGNCTFNGTSANARYAYHVYYIGGGSANWIKIGRVYSLASSSSGGGALTAIISSGFNTSSGDLSAQIIRVSIRSKGTSTNGVYIVGDNVTLGLKSDVVGGDARFAVHTVTARTTSVNGVYDIYVEQKGYQHVDVLLLHNDDVEMTYNSNTTKAISDTTNMTIFSPTLPYAGNSESAKEIRIPYGSGSVYLQIGVSDTGNYLALGTNMADGVMVNYAAEASTAYVAGRLGTASVGSPDNPIYLNNGVPTACNWWVS